MSGGEWYFISEVILFLAMLWIVGRVCRLIGISSLLGEIAVGIVMGPQVANLVPMVEAHEEHGHTTYHSLWQTFGALGVTLMIAESGTHIHFHKVKEVGFSAFLAGVIGTFLPMISALVLSILLVESADLTSGFAAGCTLAPTSVGIALNLLTEAKQLNSLPGQTIVTAAILDDIFSIILLVVLTQIGETGELDLISLAFTFTQCFLFLLVGTIFALYAFKDYLPKILHKIPIYPNLNYQPRDEIHLFLIAVILVGYCWIGSAIGSHLLGAFIAGMSFSQVNRSMYVWRRQLKKIIKWLMKFFFACSVAFTIPIQSLFSLESLWKGLIFALVPGVLGKLLAGFASWEYKYIVGFAMVGRGEFAYLVGATAINLQLITEELYAAVVWALLIAVLVAPIAFKKVLAVKFRSQEKSGIKYFKIVAEGPHHTGMHFEIVDVLHNLRLDILEAKVVTDGDVDSSEFTVAVAEGDLDTQIVEEILHDIKEAVGDYSAQALLRPLSDDEMLHFIDNEEEKSKMLREESMRSIEKSDRKDSVVINFKPNKADFELTPAALALNSSHRVASKSMSDLHSMRDEYWLEIKCLIKHQPYVLAKLISGLESMNIILCKAFMSLYLNTESDIIYARVENDTYLQGTDVSKIKANLKKLLVANNIKIGSEMLVKRVKKKYIVLPHAQSFSHMLRSSATNNPLLSNKKNERCGYEIMLNSDSRPGIINDINNSLKHLNLDIKSATINNDTDAGKIEMEFFGTENGFFEFDGAIRRLTIEKELKALMKKLGIEVSEIFVEAIEFGKEHSRTSSVHNIETGKLNDETDKKEDLVHNADDDITQHNTIANSRRNTDSFTDLMGEVNIKDQLQNSIELNDKKKNYQENSKEKAEISVESSL